MKKKGISPLIATVLILGFTIALAAIIMNWAGVFTKKMTETTEETANVQMLCAIEVAFDLEDVCVDTDSDPDDYKLLVSNNGARDIESFVIRYYAGADKVAQQKHDCGGDGIVQFGIESLSSEDGVAPIDITTPIFDGAGVNKIEMMPVAEIGGKEVTCSSNIDTYGSEVGNPFEACQ